MSESVRACFSCIPLTIVFFFFFLLVSLLFYVGLYKFVSFWHVGVHRWEESVVFLGEVDFLCAWSVLHCLGVPVLFCRSI